MVHHLKYAGYSALGHEVARIIDRTVGRRVAAALVPVPLAQRRKRDRGYNQASVIARELARRWRVPVLERLVQRTRDTKSQTTLSPHDRHENVAGAFVAGAPPAPEGPAGRRGQATPIILIDDVLTTGATVVAAAEALQTAGWQTIEAITFARALPFARRVSSE
jgi:ComF family protein